MKIVLNFDEMSKILLEHVRKNMNTDVNNVEIAGVYSTHREDFCVLTNKKPTEQE